WGAMRAGLYMAGGVIVLGGSQGLFVGRLSREWGELTMTIVGLGITGVSIAGLAFCHTVLTLTPCAIGVAVGGGRAFGTASPAFASLCSKACGAHEAGETMSQSQAMVHTGRVLGALAWGYVF